MHYRRAASACARAGADNALVALRYIIMLADSFPNKSPTVTGGAPPPARQKRRPPARSAARLRAPARPRAQPRCTLRG